MRPTLKVKRLEKVSREKYIELYAVLKELRGLSTKENKDLVSDLVNNIKSKLFQSRYELSYNGKVIGTTKKDFITLHKKLDYIKDHIERIRVSRKQAREIKVEPVSLDGFQFLSSGGLRVTPLKDIKRKHHPKIAREYKKPKALLNYVGIEIEMISDISQEHMAMLIALNKLDHKIRVMSDGSIRAEGELEHTFEINILDTETNIYSTLDRFNTMITSSGFKFKTNSSCGTHIHLDMRQRDVEECYTTLYNNLDTLLKTVSKDRLDNRYCKRNKHSHMADAANDYDGSGARYQMINPCSFEKHGTLELRLFQGTLDIDKIKDWVSLSLGIINSQSKAVVNV